MIIQYYQKSTNLSQNLSNIDLDIQYSMDSKTKPNLPTSYELQPERYCMQCSKNQTPDNTLREPFGPGWSVCTACLKAEGQMLLKFKLNKTDVYPEIQKIVDGLYLGNQDAATSQKIIQEYEISAICACGSYLLTPFEGRMMKGKFQDILYMKYDIADFYDQKIDHHFDANCQWIEERLAEGRNVLVHCAAGISRSASFVIAYLMNKKQMVYPDALAFVKQRRRVINPNSGFRTQLEKYGQEIIYRKIGSQYVQKQSECQQKKCQKEEPVSPNLNQ